MAVVVPIQKLQLWMQKNLQHDADLLSSSLSVLHKYNYNECHFQSREHLLQAFRGLYTTKPDMFWDFEIQNLGISATTEARYAARSTTDKFLERYVHAKMRKELWSRDEKTILNFIHS